MAKLELALLVGEESKSWLVRFEAALEKLQTLTEEGLGKLEATGVEAKAENDEDDSDFAPAATKKASGKKQKGFEDEEEESTSEDEESLDEPKASEDDEDEDSFVTPTKKKAKKLTADDVNDACKKMAAKIGGKEGRNQVLALLKKKFKTTSVSDLKPESYAAAIAAMGV